MGIIKVKARFLNMQCPLCHSDADHRQLDISIKCFKRYNYHFSGQNVLHFLFILLHQHYAFFGSTFTCDLKGSTDCPWTTLRCTSAKLIQLGFSEKGTQAHRYDE